jgi:hypothetical protein
MSGLSSGEVLAAGFDPVDGALAGAQLARELLLGEPALLAGVPDEGADAAGEEIRHNAGAYLT